MSTSGFNAKMFFFFNLLPAGNMSDVRTVRKRQQLNNLVAMVTELARPSDAIVDFCSGTVRTLSRAAARVFLLAAEPIYSRLTWIKCNRWRSPTGSRRNRPGLRAPRVPGGVWIYEVTGVEEFGILDLELQKFAIT